MGIQEELAMQLTLSNNNDRIQSGPWGFIKFHNGDAIGHGDLSNNNFGDIMGTSWGDHGIKFLKDDHLSSTGFVSKTALEEGVLCHDHQVV